MNVLISKSMVDQAKRNADQPLPDYMAISKDRYKVIKDVSEVPPPFSAIVDEHSGPSLFLFHASRDPFRLASAIAVDTEGKDGSSQHARELYDLGVTAYAKAIQSIVSHTQQTKLSDLEQVDAWLTLSRLSASASTDTLTRDTYDRLVFSRGGAQELHIVGDPAIEAANVKQFGIQDRISVLFLSYYIVMRCFFNEKGEKKKNFVHLFAEAEGAKKRWRKRGRDKKNDNQDDPNDVTGVSEPMDPDLAKWEGTLNRLYNQLDLILGVKVTLGNGKLWTHPWDVKKAYLHDFLRYLRDSTSSVSMEDITDIDYTYSFRYDRSDFHKKNFPYDNPAMWDAMGGKHLVVTFANLCQSLGIANLRNMVASLHNEEKGVYARSLWTITLSTALDIIRNALPIHEGSLSVLKLLGTEVTRRMGFRIVEGGYSMMIAPLAAYNPTYEGRPDKVETQIALSIKGDGHGIHHTTGVLVPDFSLTHPDFRIQLDDKDGEDNQWTVEPDISVIMSHPIANLCRAPLPRKHTTMPAKMFTDPVSRYLDVFNRCMHVKQKAQVHPPLPDMYEAQDYATERDALIDKLNSTVAWSDLDPDPYYRELSSDADFLRPYQVALCTTQDFLNRIDHAPTLSVTPGDSNKLDSIAYLVHPYNLWSKK